VVDATNYVMLELGQPMHAFDLGRLDGEAIVVRTPGPDELRFTTLDDEERTLSEDMLMICDARRPVAIAGVMGGQNSEVDEATSDILLECALFDPKSIRATRRALGMSTDASYRFERGVDPSSMSRALERCVEVILATAGGEMDGPALDCVPAPHEPRTIPLRLSRIERVLGIPFEGTRVRALLGPLGFEVSDPVDGVVSVLVPEHRSYDVPREVDLIEEVAPTHGYDAFPDTLGPARPGTVPDDGLFQLCDDLRSALAARGLFEAHTPAFAPPGEGDLEVSNPLAATEPFMRRAILPALLRRIEYNLARGNRDVRLFEIGTSFRKQGPGEAPHEATHIAAVLTGRREPPHWSRSDEPLEIWDLRGLLDDVVLQAHGVAAVVTPAGADVADGLLDAEASFIVQDVTGAALGHGGRVSAQRVDLPAWAGNVFALELMLPEGPVDAPAVTYQRLPQQPATERDLALLVPPRVSAGELFDRIRESAGSHLESLQLFDVYTGEGVAAGARSLAFRLRFRASDRTLKDKEVDRSVNAVLQRLQEELGVEARG
jgi:phenylalanyl-tRNA synthetase beta chain